MGHPLRKLNESLVNAISEGDAEETARLLDAGAPFGKADVYGRLPLNTAAEFGHLDILRLLLDRGADANVRDLYGRTPLVEAVININEPEGQFFGVITALLEAGAEVDSRDQADQTPLIQAARTGNLDLVRLLVDAGADPLKGRLSGRTALWEAAFDGHDEVARFLAGAVRSRPFVGFKRRIMCGAYLGDLGALSIRLGARLVMTTGDTPLMAASLCGHLGLVRALLSAGSAPSAQNEEGVTPLIQATRAGHLDVVEELLRKGADLEAIVNPGHTALTIAIENGREDVVDTLLEGGANIDHLAGVGTPLSVAICHQRFEIAESLLEQGASAADEHGLALSEATAHGSVDWVRRLLERGTDPNVAPALMAASIKGHLFRRQWHHVVVLSAVHRPLSQWKPSAQQPPGPRSGRWRTSSGAPSSSQTDPIVGEHLRQD